MEAILVRTQVSTRRTRSWRSSTLRWLARTADDDPRRCVSLLRIPHVPASVTTAPSPEPLVPSKPVTGPCEDQEVVEAA
jgi:hypothetical protein